MEIFVRHKKKLKWESGSIIPRCVPEYRLIWSEHGYCTEEKFNDYLDLVNFLIKDKIYKQNYFPTCINIREFIEKGFSIYFY